MLAYVTYVRPKLEYACSVWDPHQHNLSNTLESIQNRAARFIYSEYSYHASVSELKSRAGLTNLESRRLISRLCLFHKFYHSPLHISAILPAHRQSSRINHSKAVYPPRRRLPLIYDHFCENRQGLERSVCRHHAPLRHSSLQGCSRITVC